MPRIGLVGPSYTLTSGNADAQKTVNLYPETDESGAGNAPIILLSTPGLKIFSDLTPAPPGCQLDIRSFASTTQLAATSVTVPLPDVRPNDFVLYVYGIRLSGIAAIPAVTASDNFVNNWTSHPQLSPQGATGGAASVNSGGTLITNADPNGVGFVLTFTLTISADKFWCSVVVVKDAVFQSSTSCDTSTATPPSGTAASFAFTLLAGESLVISASVGDQGLPTPDDAFVQVTTTGLQNGGGATFAKLTSAGAGTGFSGWNLPFMSSLAPSPNDYFIMVPVWVFGSACG